MLLVTSPIASLPKPQKGTIPGMFYCLSSNEAEELSMNGIIYIIGLIVVIGIVLSFFGLR